MPAPRFSFASSRICRLAHSRYPRRNRTAGSGLGAPGDLIVSTCLAMVAVAVLATAAPAPAASSNSAVSAGPQAVQYVQVQYRNVLKDAGASQPVFNPVKSLFHSFLSGILHNVISGLNPI